jgi:hypothetical protein
MSKRLLLLAKSESVVSCQLFAKMVIISHVHITAIWLKQFNPMASDVPEKPRNSIKIYGIEPKHVTEAQKGKRYR